MIDPPLIRPGSHVAGPGIEGEVVTIRHITEARIVASIRTAGGSIERVAIDLDAAAAVLAPPMTAHEGDVLARMVLAGKTPRMPAGRIDLILATAVLAGKE